MAEINNNIHNYGYNRIDRIDMKKEKVQNSKDELQKEIEEYQYVPDTGILGRSQIYGANGGNIAKSVDEAVYMTKNHLAALGCSEAIFDTMYQKYIDSGMSESDAYMKALMAEKEFLDIITK